MLQLVVRFFPLIDVFCSMIGIGNIERERMVLGRERDRRGI